MQLRAFCARARRGKAHSTLGLRLVPECAIYSSMSAAIVKSTEKVTLLGASALPGESLAESLARAPVLVAADGGVDAALALGHMPAAVIGDFDSASEKSRAQVPKDRMHRIADQSSTDFDKALRHIEAPLVLAVGFTGRRLDHELAVYNALVRHADRPVIVAGSDDICFHASSEMRLSLDPGTRVSLFPMAEVRCETAGLKWPTNEIVFRPWDRVGTSNEAASSEVMIAPSGRGMLVILPCSALDAAMQALDGAGQPSGG